MPLLGKDFFSALNHSVAILGPGLIGGSLAMALRRNDNPWNVSVWTRHEETVPSIAQRLPDCLVTSDLHQAVNGVGIVVLCVPPLAIESLGKALAPLLAPSTVITDAGSVKRHIIAALEIIWGGRFIGAHPMAGSEQSGIGAARPDLFDGALCLLTPTAKSLPDALKMVHEMWVDAGCVLQTISPDEHDHAIARVSHLPHAAAAALVHAICKNNPEITAFAGNGYRDTTRVASGPEAMWAEILLENCGEITAGIEDLQNSLNQLKTFLARGDYEETKAFLAEARKLRANKN